MSSFKMMALVGIHCKLSYVDKVNQKEHISQLSVLLAT